jgi:mono/diheme cytochrome c family protein
MTIDPELTRMRMRWMMAAAVVLFATTVVSAGRAAVAAPEQPSAPPESATYRDVYSGWKWWHVYCYRCHGVDAVGTTNAPNLSDPTLRHTPAEFLKIVKTGVPDTAMQSWSKLLDDKQIGQIHLYVRARADKVLPPGRPDEIGQNGGPWTPPAGWPRRAR